MESRPNFPSTIVTEYVMVRVFLYVQKLEIQYLETQKSESTPHLNRLRGLMIYLDSRQMLFNVHGIETQFPLNNSNRVRDG